MNWEHAISSAKKIYNTNEVTRDVYNAAEFIYVWYWVNESQKVRKQIVKQSNEKTAE